jgi:arylsulfatase A-like enzyme
MTLAAPPRAHALLAALCASCLLAGCGSDTGRPNIVLVVIDTLRADKLGAYGFPEATSPALDALAARGVLFRNVLAQSSWTRASIASLVTGLHPRSLGIFHEYHDALAGRFVTLAEVLWTGGYRTFGATANPNINASYHFDQGFDEYSDSRVIFPWMTPEPGAQSTAHAPLPAGRDLYRALVESIAASQHRPFYVQIAVMEVHEHIQMRNRPELYSDSRGAGDHAGLFAGQRDADYLRTVRQATDEVVAFIEEVAALPGGENTLFVITSDHGEGLTDHPSVPNADRHGFVLYESNLRVPLLLYHPGGALAAGRVVDQPVRLLDVMPTLLDFAGLTGPRQMQGRSLLPLARGDAEVPLPEIFVAETRFQRRNKIAAYTPAWKYIENREHESRLPRQSLHRVGTREDGARTNVASQHPDIVARLASQVREWEKTHPPAESTRPALAPEALERQQLRDLGYLE